MKRKKNIEINPDCLSGIAMVAVIVPWIILNGWILQTLWGWFVVPLFGLDALPLAGAIGIKLVGSIFTHRNSNKGDDTGWKSIMSSLTTTGLVLLTGFIVHSFWPI